MYRPILTNGLRILPQARATFSTTPRAMAAGDLGSPKVGGSKTEDAFSKKEKANEDWSILAREKEKLLELKRKIAEQHEHLHRLENHLDELANQRSGNQK